MIWLDGVGNAELSFVFVRCYCFSNVETLKFFFFDDDNFSTHSNLLELNNSSIDLLSEITWKIKSQFISLKRKHFINIFIHFNFQFSNN